MRNIKLTSEYNNICVTSKLYLTLKKNNLLYVISFMTKETGMHVLVNIHVQDIANVCTVQIHIPVIHNDQLYTYHYKSSFVKAIKKFVATLNLY